MKKITIIGVIVLIVIVLFAFMFKGSGKQEVSMFDVSDTVGNFYTPWLKSAQDETAEPSRSTLAKSPFLSKELREKIQVALKNKEAIDPVLCQTVVPENISFRTVLESETEAQMLITSRDKSVTEQSLVTLTRLNNGWYISDIKCSLGEFAPEREFSFDREGYLLKGSIPAPYDSKNWHLVFDENGVPGHAAPLFYSNESQCTDLKGNKAVCTPDQFTEATKVLVRGEMTERGVTVKQQVFVK